LDDNVEQKNVEDKSRSIFRISDELSSFSKKLNIITGSEYKRESSEMYLKIVYFVNFSVSKKYFYLL